MGFLSVIHVPGYGQKPQALQPGLQIVKYHNPGAVVDLGVGLWAHPLPVDYDHDGKIDLLVSSAATPYNGVFFFRNLSGGKMPVFDKPVCLSKGVPDIEISYVKGKPELLIPGARLGNWFHDSVVRTTPLYPRDSILKHIKKVRADQWKLVDYDGDGDPDIIVGVGDWGDYGWDNAYDSSGHWRNGPLRGYVYLVENKNGHYMSPVKLTTGDGHPIDVFGAPSPNFFDFDGDGDLDLVCGSFLDHLTWYENIGTRTRPEYAPGRLLKNPAGLIHMPLEMMNVTAIDWDGDGDVDLIVGQEDGRVALMENTGAVKDHMPVFKSPVFFKQKADDLKFGVLSTPYGVDWDGDGLEDIISGNSAGNIAFIRNLGGYPPRWAPPRLLKAAGKVIRVMAGPNGSIQGPAEAKWGYTTFTVADWDGDGLKDLIVNSIWGKVIWFKNTGTRRHPRLAAPQPVKVDGPVVKPSWNWWNPVKGNLVTQWRTTPYATDWNSDGKMDLVMLDYEGYLSYYERKRENGRLMLSPGKRIFYGDPSGFDTNNRVTIETEGLLRLNTGSSGASGRRKFCIVDWNQDGALDLMVNSRNITFFKNVTRSPNHILFRDEGTLGNLRLAGHTTSPTVVDWNKDGIPDLLVGAEDGHFYYMVNPNHH